MDITIKQHQMSVSFVQPLLITVPHVNKLNAKVALKVLIVFMMLHQKVVFANKVIL